jgi:hypothetical protein
MVIIQFFDNIPGTQKNVDTNIDNLPGGYYNKENN